jgi:hypothetical protein
MGGNRTKSGSSPRSGTHSAGRDQRNTAAYLPKIHQQNTENQHLSQLLEMNLDAGKMNRNAAAENRTGTIASRRERTTEEKLRQYRSKSRGASAHGRHTRKSGRALTDRASPNQWRMKWGCRGEGKNRPGDGS